MSATDRNNSDGLFSIGYESAGSSLHWLLAGVERNNGFGDLVQTFTAAMVDCDCMAEQQAINLKLID